MAKRKYLYFIVAFSDGDVLSPNDHKEAFGEYQRNRGSATLFGMPSHEQQLEIIMSK